MIELNCDPNLKLPYIYIPEIDSKLMIDTGSMRSFISPRKAYEYFSHAIRHEPFQVISTHASSSHSEVIDIPLLPTFNSSEHHKFYLYDVDSRYDGVVGDDLLRQIGALIDLKRNILKTNTTIIPIIHNGTSYEVRIAPRTEQRVKLPTDLHTGEGILEYKELHKGVRMPSAIVKCENGYATTVIQNCLDAEAVLTVTKPFKINVFEKNESEMNFIEEKTNIEIDELLEENLEKLRLEHMNEEERKVIYELCKEYKDIFYCENLPLTFTNEVKHFIRTKHEDPIYLKPYRQPPTQAMEIKQQVDKLLKDNVIQESYSPWSAPVHLVPKKKDASGETKYRMVIDYRRLNDITHDDKYPLPNITDIFDKLGKSNYFSTIDLASGYHQIEVNKDDRQKTAFSTQYGHYEFLRMPFGLKTAPATFQRAMDNILRGLQGIHCLVYLDDIIIFSSSLQEHVQKLRTVFDRLRQTNLKIQLDKSEFLRKEVLYLGHTITKDGLKPNSDKIDAVLNYPLPKTTTDIRSFLGLVGYYRRFIKDFSKVTQPLTACLKKRNKIVIDQKYTDAFEKCKELLISAPLLQYPDYEKPFILTTDASNVAIGAVLSQGTVGTDKPVAYASRTLSDTESRYSTIERELLAIVWAVKHFRPYLYGRKFTIYTDHAPLRWVQNLKEPNSKLTRWGLRLQEYDYDIIYKNGKQNSNADALSRIKLNALDSDSDADISMKVQVDNQDLKIREHLDELEDRVAKLAKDKPNRDSSDTLTISSEATVSLHSELSRTLSGSESTVLIEPNYPMRPDDSSTDTVHSNAECDSLGIPILHEAIDTKPNQILVFEWFKNETQVKDISRDKQKVLEVFMPVHNESLIKEFLKEYVRPKIKYFIYFENEQHRREFSNVIISLFKQGTIDMHECTKRVIYIEDEKEQKAVILNHHDGKTCHRGIKETMLRIKRNYYWNNMQETIAAVLNGCEACQKMKYDRKPIKPVLQLTQTQTAPFQEIFMDIFSIENKHYLTLVDAFSKIGQAIEISNRSTGEIVRALIKYFSMYGVPTKISCDPGTEFNNEMIREMTSMYKIQLHITTPNNPNSTGIVERFHSTIIEIYRLARYDQKCTDAASIMTYAIMAYNNSIHSATDLTPFEVVFGHTDSNHIFSANFEKSYTQQILKDHAKRTKYLYNYLSERMLQQKEKVRDRKAGEKQIDLEEGQVIFTKTVNTRKSKDKPRFNKAIVRGAAERNVVPVRVGQRQTKVPIKNVKRPPQVLPDHTDPGSPKPGPSGSKD